jgi:imidazoleglycerol-phosphate dehydratase
MRKAQIKRKTKETDINVKLNIDGKGKAKIKTGIGFLDHMLELFAKHGLFDLEIKAKGDLKVDIHHTNEDIGISLGEAFKEALGNKEQIRRFGFASVPMDEALVKVSVDISGRPYLPTIHTPAGYKAEYEKKEIYTLDYARQFLKAFVDNLGFNLNIELSAGRDPHHILEALFKALGRALDEATQIDRRIKGVPSTKGRL